MINKNELYIVNYCHPNCEPLKNIMRLSKDEAFVKAKELSDANPQTQAFCRFADFENYYPQRLKADEIIYESFLALGGQPEEKHPLSFVLSGSQYLNQWFGNGNIIKIPLLDIPTNQISFTFGDSTAMIERTGEIKLLTKEMLLEDISMYNGTLNEYMREIESKYYYIEVQLWSDEVIQDYYYKLFTEDTKYVNYSHPSIQKKAQELFKPGMSEIEKAKAAYYFVRDEIKHSFDIGAKVVSITASDALLNGTGVCHVKSNLLAALLRSQGIPAGFCFQHLTLDDNDTSKGYVTHGYNAVYVDNHWIKLDSRGNKENVHAEFSLGEPILAFPARPELKEYDIPGIFAKPNRTSMRYLEGLEELDPDKYADCNEVEEEPDILL